MSKKVRLKKAGIRRIIIILSFLMILAVRFIPHCGELYARHIYPALSSLLSWISSVVPFSLTEWIVVAAIASLIIYPFWAHRKKTKGKHIFAIEVEILCWMLIWFYAGWALNYYRDNIFQRAQIVPCKANETEFSKFLDTYIDSLNANYTNIDSLNEKDIQDRIKGIYSQVGKEYGLCQPHSFQHPKSLAFNRLYSAVGVLGYMGPFADESHLNEQLLPVEYAFIYAHELSHLLSVSSEAEANFWGYEICIHSTDQTIRYSGYFGILPYVLGNAQYILGEQEYKRLAKRIDKRILKQAYEVQDFWQSQHSPILDKLQDALLNAMLKGNNIPTGILNYDEVIETIISFDNSKKELFNTNEYRN